jgi:hypothetical protein
VAFFSFLVWRLVRAVRFGFSDPEFRGLLSLVGLVLVIGTIFYARFEEWSLLDSFYFSVTTLATVGYGDFSPTTAPTKIFTVAYLFVGLGLLAAFAQRLGRQLLESRPHQRHEE